jgi:hypothetical protein
MNTHNPQSGSSENVFLNSRNQQTTVAVLSPDAPFFRILLPGYLLIAAMLVTLCANAGSPSGHPSDNPPIDKLNSRLFDLGGMGGDVLDANVVVFNNAYSNAVNGDDALKMSNSSENFAIKRDGRLLVVEGRQAIVEFDTVYFEIWNLQMQQYTLEFDARFANIPGLTATLMDRYLGTTRQLKINDTTRINFTCDANAGSRARDRFRVIFRKPLNSLPVRFLSVDANRHDGKAIVGWQVDGERGVRYYEVESSTNGRSFRTAGRVQAEGGMSAAIRRYNWEQENAQEIATYFRIKNVDESGSWSYSPVVKLEGLKSGRHASVYPNPVAGKNLNLMLRSFARGSYTVELVGSFGATLYKTLITHSGGSSGYQLQLPQHFPAGVYCVRLLYGVETTVIPGVQILN